MGDVREMTVVPAVLPRTRRAYDHRLREQVVRCGAKVVASHVQIPRSTASTWRRRGLRPVVTTEPFDQEKQHALDSSVRWQKRARAFAAVVRLLLALLRASGFSLTGMRLPEGQAKAGILRAVTSAESFLPLAIILRILELESGRYHAWRRAETVCELTDRSSCPRTRPGQLTATEVAKRPTRCTSAQATMSPLDLPSAELRPDRRDWQPIGSWLVPGAEPTARGQKPQRFSMCCTCTRKSPRCPDSQLCWALTPMARACP